MVAVIIIVVSFSNASRKPDVTDTSWLSDVRSKVTIQHISSMTDGPGFTTDKQLSAKQIIVLIPIIQSDLNEATPLGSEMTVNGDDGQLDITFNDGSGITIFDIEGNGSFEIGPLNQTGLGTATFSFQDSTLTSKIEAFQ